MRTPTRRGLIVAGAGALAAPALFTTSSRAQGAFPNKPMRIIVPYPAGGQTDGIARVYGEYLSRKLGQSVVVENKGGAGGTMAIPSSVPSPRR
jgi:tripartite-type tricarboxylate transporter receptor subunit TctC